MPVPAKSVLDDAIHHVHEKILIALYNYLSEKYTVPMLSCSTTESLIVIRLAKTDKGGQLTEEKSVRMCKYQIKKVE